MGWITPKVRERRMPEPQPHRPLWFAERHDQRRRLGFVHPVEQRMIGRSRRNVVATRRSDDHRLTLDVRKKCHRRRILRFYPGVFGKFLEADVARFPAALEEPLAPLRLADALRVTFHVNHIVE
jgi:hypothetical protein